jgi:hypothetical protein
VGTGCWLAVRTWGSTRSWDHKLYEQAGVALCSPFVQLQRLCRQPCLPRALACRNGEAYLVEVTSHLKPSDVLSFHQKVQFARKKLEREVIPLILALSMDTKAEESMRSLSIGYWVRATVSR